MQFLKAKHQQREEPFVEDSKVSFTIQSITTDYTRSCLLLLSFIPSSAPAGPSGVEASSSSGSMYDELLEGCSSFMAASTVFLRLIQSEARLMEGIIPPVHQKYVLDSLTKQPIDFFMREGEVGMTHWHMYCTHTHTHTHTHT